MKKIILFLSTLLCCVTLCLGFTACDNNDGTTPPSTEQPGSGGGSESGSGSGSGSGEAIPTKGLNYTLSGDGTYYTLSGIGTATATNIVIAREINGIPVTSIGYGAFNGCSDLTSITIPNSVTSIGDDAFFFCYDLMSITIPNSVTSIGMRAFFFCYDLMSITIPDSVTSIGNNAFKGCSGIIQEEGGVSYVDKWVIDCDESVTSVNLRANTVGIADSAFAYCSGLTSITVESGNTKYHSAGNCLIETASKTLILGCKNSVIPTDGSVASIGDEAFFSCYGLTSITIPNSVTSIGMRAFFFCYDLMSITIPDSVTSIGDGAFSACSSLTSITIPNSVTSIGYSVFSGCSNLTSITVASGNTKYHSAGNCLIETANKTLIMGCKNSVIPTDGSITSIGYGAFQNCSGLTLELVIPNSVTSIGDVAFYGCSDLMRITIPNSVTSIGDVAFSGCGYLTSITYQGTKAQWNAISKGSGWNDYTGAYTITCTDGTLTKA